MENESKNLKKDFRDENKKKREFKENSEIKKNNDYKENNKRNEFKENSEIKKNVDCKKNNKNNKSEENSKFSKVSKSSKIKDIIEYTIVFLVIIVNVFLIIKSVKNPNKTPDFFGKKAFVIVSGSMIPEIEIGDIVIINDTQDVNINDIIAFRRDSNIIVHRIINKMEVNGKTMYQTKGDNNNIPDTELVDVSDIEGIYINKIPYIGKLLMFLYNNLAIVVVIIVVILIVKYYFFEK